MSVGVALVGLVEDVHLKATMRVGRECLRADIGDLRRGRAVLDAQRSCGDPLTDPMMLDVDVARLAPRGRVGGPLHGAAVVFTCRSGGGEWGAEIVHEASEPHDVAAYFAERIVFRFGSR